LDPPEATGAGPVALTLIDADVHDSSAQSDLYPYLSERSRRYLELIGLRQQAPYGVLAGAYKMGSRSDAWGPEGQPPGTDPAFFCEQLFGGSESQLAILNPMHAQIQERFGPGTPAHVIRDVHRAQNELVQEKWLEHDPRIRGALVVPFEDPDASIGEIERWAGDRRFVQVVFPFRTGQPMGQERYWSIYEAAVQHDLPIGLHPAIQHTHTGAGWPSFYYEHHTGLPNVLFSQVASLICEGTFDRFPGLRIVIIEGGWTWVTPLMWRLQRAWRQLRAEVPHVQRSPSEYIRDHFWFTTQPVDQPEQPQQLVALYEQFAQAGLAGKLMFSSDYPHWDYDDPEVAIPRTFSDDARRGIFVENALGCYERLRV
jgi:predicted TIM-barrel fold metal-dependent hydrolase